MLEIRAEREDRKAKETEPKPEQTAEEKQAGEYRCNIARMIYDIGKRYKTYRNEKKCMS